MFPSLLELLQLACSVFRQQFADLPQWQAERLLHADQPTVSTSFCEEIW